MPIVPSSKYRDWSEYWWYPLRSLFRIHAAAGGGATRCQQQRQLPNVLAFVRKSLFGGIAGSNSRGKVCQGANLRRLHLIIIIIIIKDHLARCIRLPITTGSIPIVILLVMGLTKMVVPYQGLTVVLIYYYSVTRHTWHDYSSPNMGVCSIALPQKAHPWDSSENVKKSMSHRIFFLPSPWSMWLDNNNNKQFSVVFFSFLLTHLLKTSKLHACTPLCLVRLPIQRLFWRQIASMWW